LPFQPPARRAYASERRKAKQTIPLRGKIFLLGGDGILKFTKDKPHWNPDRGPRSRTQPLYDLPDLRGWGDGEEKKYPIAFGEI